MRTIQKLILFTFIFSAGTASFAQGIFVKGGVNFAKMLAQDKNGTYSDEFSFLTGFNGSIGGEIPFAEIFALETSIGVSTKGFIFEDSFSILGEEISSKVTTNLLYLDVPVSVKVMFGNDRSKVFIAAGPYVGVGIMGKSTSELTTAGITETNETDIEWGSDENEDDLNRLDFGARVAAGFILNSIILEAAYQYGLANISSDKSDDIKFNNRVISLSLGLRIGR